MNLVLFDGVCNLCNGFVQFLLRYDQRQRLTFGSLQSEAAKQILAESRLNTVQMTSIVYIRHGVCYTHSTAVLYILTDLGSWWRLLGIMRLVPRFIRDPIYNWIALNRYRWAGKREFCMIPAPSLESRFI